MSVIVVKNDVYDKNGCLLIRKGKKITDRTLNILKKHEISYEVEGLIADNNESSNFSPHITSFAGRKQIQDKRILERPTKVLNKILFESKTKPWWFCIKTLSNYCDLLYTHSIDVALISLIMAVELKYNNEELFILGLGALLHDVGRLLIPKNVTNKSENISDSEREAFIKQHCELGVSIIDGLELPKDVCDIIMQHHERLDGTGLPKGLKKEDVSLNTRIVMVADTLDDLTTYLPGEETKSMKAAIEKLKNKTEKYPQELICLLEKMLN